MASGLNRLGYGATAVALAGVLLLPITARSDKAAQPPPSADEVVEAGLEWDDFVGPMEISDREPWNETPEIPNQRVSVRPAEKGDIDVPPAALGPDAEGKLSVLVHLNPGMDLADRNLSPARVGLRNFVALRQARIQYEYDILPHVINVRGLTPAAVEELKRLPGVLKVEEDTEVHGFHNDSIPLIRARQDQLQAAGLSATGAGVRICIIDTGIDSNSIMYSTRIDAAAGWDFVNNDSNPEDDNGHGSHVAGTALGGTGVNANFGCVGPESMQGVAPQATLIGIKVLAANGSGSTSNVIAGIDRCASTTLPGGQADVINLSLGSGQFSSVCDSNTTAIAVNNASNAGVTVVAAAGNNGYTNALASPACASGAIAVAAIYDDSYPSCEFPNQTSFSFCLNSFCTSSCTDNSPSVNQRCCFSNRSSMLDVAAPGCIIFSDDSTVAGGNGLVGFCGTSQAAPHVAGLAGLLLHADPSLTPADVRQAIRQGAVDLGVAGFDSNFGYGRIDAINSLQLIAPGCSTHPECDDGLFCNGVEQCVGGTCQAGTSPCPGQLCRESDDTCVNCLTNGDCSDGQFCNGAETCNAAGNCQAGTAINCNDGIACTSDSCNETTDQCNNVPNHGLCDDGLFCNGAETCSTSTGCVSGSAPCSGECDEVNDECVSSGSVYIVFTAATSVPGVGTVQNEDIVAYNLSTGTWSLVFDGSNVGLGSFSINGLAVLPGGDLLISCAEAGTIGGISTDDSDILRFTPTSLGANTAGTYSMYFDGSDVGLSTNNEDIDGISLDSTGALIISTLGTMSANGASGADTDLFRFAATSLGTNTSGTFSVYFDGSDVGLSDGSSEDIDGVSLTPAGTILLSTLGAVSVPGVSAADEDIIEFSPTQLGATTAGSYVMFLDLSTLGIATSANVAAVEFVP